MFRPILLLAAAVALTACQLSPPEPANQTPVRIAAWNIEHLTAATGAGCAPRDEAALDLVAAYRDRRVISMTSVGNSPGR